MTRKGTTDHVRSYRETPSNEAEDVLYFCKFRKCVWHRPDGGGEMGFEEVRYGWVAHALRYGMVTYVYSLVCIKDMHGVHCYIFLPWMLGKAYSSIPSDLLYVDDCVLMATSMEEHGRRIPEWRVIIIC